MFGERMWCDCTVFHFRVSYDGFEGKRMLAVPVCANCFELYPCMTPHENVVEMRVKEKLRRVWPFLIFI